jgi:hypothetical protein
MFRDLVLIGLSPPWLNVAVLPTHQCRNAFRLIIVRQQNPGIVIIGQKVKSFLHGWPFIYCL